MKFFRKALILVIVAVLAGFSYWYFEVKKKRERKVAEEKEALLFEESDKRVVKLTLKKKGAETIVLEWERKQQAPNENLGEEEEEAEEGKWSVLAPIDTGGDDVAIDSIMNGLLKGSRESIVWESLEKEEEYGLHDPELSLRFYYEGDSTPRGIDFGIESLDKQKVFTKVVGQERIFAVPAGLRDSVTKNLFDVRDKRLVPIEKEEITGISIVTGIDSIFLTREGENWYILPDRIRASDTRVDLYTGTLRWENFVEVVEEKAENFGKYGIDRPRIIITFKLVDDSVFMFIVGDSVKEGDTEFFYGARTNDNIIFQMKSDTVQRLITSEFELKERSIFDFDSDEVQAVALEFDGKHYSFTRKDEDWELTDLSPAEEGKNYIGEILERSYKVDNIIRGISTAEYEEKEPVKRGDPDYQETGIETPKYRIEIEFENGRKPLTIVLTEKDDESGKIYLSSDDGETAYYTSGYFVSSFPQTVEDLF